MIAAKQLIPVGLMVVAILLIANQLTSGGRRLTCPTCHHQAQSECSESCKDESNKDECFATCVENSCYRCVPSFAPPEIESEERSPACQECMDQQGQFCNTACAPAAIACHENCALERCSRLCRSRTAATPATASTTDQVRIDGREATPANEQAPATTGSAATPSTTPTEDSLVSREVAACHDCLREADYRCHENCDSGDKLAADECYRGCAKALCQGLCTDLLQMLSPQ